MTISGPSASFGATCTRAVERALFGEVTVTTIRVLEPERAIADTPGRFVLLPRGGLATRLLLRESLDDPIRSGAMWILWDPMHFVMEQRMLQGVKERAEGRPFVPPVLQLAAHVGWAFAALGLVGLFMSRSKWRPWLVLPVGLVGPSLQLTGDVNSVLAGFLAVGITVAGFLAFGWRWCAPYLLLASAVALILLLAPDNGRQRARRQLKSPVRLRRGGSGSGRRRHGQTPRRSRGCCRCWRAPRSGALHEERRRTAETHVCDRREQRILLGELQWGPADDPIKSARGPAILEARVVAAGSSARGHAWPNSLAERESRRRRCALPICNEWPRRREGGCCRRSTRRR